jgi:hypothetical protein
MVKFKGPLMLLGNIYFPFRNKERIKNISTKDSKIIIPVITCCNYIFLNENINPALQLP